MATETYIIDGVPTRIRMFTMEEMAAEFDENEMLLASLDAILADWDTDKQTD